MELAMRACLSLVLALSASPALAESPATPSPVPGGVE